MTMPHNPLDAGPDSETVSLDWSVCLDYAADEICRAQHQSGNEAAAKELRLVAIAAARAYLDRAEKQLLPPGRNALSGMVI